MISVYPKYISIKYWAATVCDDYSDFSLPILHDETKWAAWAQNLVGIEPFMSAGVPSPIKTFVKRMENLPLKTGKNGQKKPIW
jgi:hypothetical protein